MDENGMFGEDNADVTLKIVIQFYYDEQEHGVDVSVEGGDDGDGYLDVEDPFP